MAYVAASLPASQRFVRGVAALVAPFDAAFAALRGWNDARVTRNALSSLSLRELDDIGLCPGDIEEIANSVAR